MGERRCGYPRGMAHLDGPHEDEQGPGPDQAADEPMGAEGVPAEEALDQAESTADAVDRAPEDQLSRPDQPDFDPRERDAY